MEAVPLDDKGRIDAYLTMYKAQMEHCRTTMDIEWRVTFAAWTLLAGIAYGAAKEGVHLPPAIAWAVLLVAPAHLVWLVMIHRSEDFDKKLWSEYRAKVLALLGESTRDATAAVWTVRGLARHAAWLSVEVGMTALLTVIAWRLLLPKA